MALTHVTKRQNQTLATFTLLSTSLADDWVTQKICPMVQSLLRLQPRQAAIIIQTRWRSYAMRRTYEYITATYLSTIAPIAAAAAARRAS